MGLNFKKHFFEKKITNEIKWKLQSFSNHNWGSRNLFKNGFSWEKIFNSFNKKIRYLSWDLKFIWKIKAEKHLLLSIFSCTSLENLINYLNVIIKIWLLLSLAPIELILKFILTANLRKKQPCQIGHRNFSIPLFRF